MITRRELMGVGAVTVGALAVGVGVVGVNRSSSLAAGHFPNCVLRTHDGQVVRFYDDLIKDKVVAINMMYAQCDGICPRMTANLLEVQDALGQRLGRDVFMYSITLKPAEDTPEALAHYVGMQSSPPRWPFLTGAPRDIERLRRRLGFYDSDPIIDADKSQHTGMVRIGNDRLDRWSMQPALGKPDQIAAAIVRISGAA